jgi:DNA-directed RNA polymerase beta subunit
VLVYELNRVVQVYIAVWRLLFQPRTSLFVSGDLAQGGNGNASASSDYSEYTEESLNKRYDLGRVGRYKINQRLAGAFEALRYTVPPAGMTALTAQDVLAILWQLVELHEGRGDTDDIDHLGNRRVRSVGELIANQFSVGLSRMARLVRERMSIVSDPDKINIDDLVNARTVSAVIQQFFGSSQLSQFMDQTNPLAEMTHKRRLSALGPGGLTRERAGFEVRDVHYSHYGRMCPIETPEGPNIGLINSLTTYARINDLGFIETPYRKVVRGVVRYPAEAKLEEAVRLVLGDRAKVFAKKGETIDAERGREIFRAMIVGAELAEDVHDWSALFPRMLAGEVEQTDWESEMSALPVLARRGERITEELADRISSQPVNVVRVVSRRAGAAARGVAPEAIRNPMSLPVRVFKPTTATVLAVTGTVLTEEVVEALYERQIDGLEVQETGDTPDEVALDYTSGVPALPAEGEVGRAVLGASGRTTHVLPVVTRITAWLSANEEETARIAQANAPLTPGFTFENEFVLCRERGDFPLLRPEEIDYMDVAPDQLVSVAAALIPFLEHDDANRALMGSNMQRQAVPLLFPSAPLVGTGLESVVAADSGAVVVARRGGTVMEVTADHILVDAGMEGAAAAGEPLRRLAQFDRYRMKKYWRTNQDTALNQRPLVRKGQVVKKGDVLADGPSTEGGELALGRNLLVAFMPWYGHNFEDAIVLSEKLVKDDVYTSIHIQELELQVRDTKRGMEEITREIPNVAEESLIDLDERGVVRIGARVKAGDILVGKITPKGETELSPEEKLLTAIFGEKAKDVKDSSLKVPPGVEGTVIDVKIFSRRIDDPILEKERGQKIGELRAFERTEIHRIGEARDEEIRELIRGREVALFLKKGTVEPFFNEGTPAHGRGGGHPRLQRRRPDDAEGDRPPHQRAAPPPDRRGQAPHRAGAAAHRGADRQDLPARRAAPGRRPAREGVPGREAEDLGGRQDGGPPREQGHHRPHRPRGGHAVPPGRHAGGRLPQPAGRAQPDERGADPGDPPGVGRPGARLRGQDPGLPGRLRGRDRHAAAPGGRHLGAPGARRRVRVAAGVRRGRRAHDRRRGAGARPHPGRALAPGDGDRPRHRLDGGRRGHPGGAGGQAPRPREYLVAAAKELAARQDGGAEEAFPAAAALAAAKGGEGLTAALEEHMAVAGLTPGGKVRLRDGRSGAQFESPVTVGTIYMLKLSHLVDDKIHARSIGPYSLVTQQPLAGKAQFGGQRFGEMEVWALEAYGAAHTLQEILTVKSDDVNGRSRVYEAIVKGENLPEPGLPESFNVLVKELQALGISVTLGA